MKNMKALLMMKICSKCKIKKQLTEYHKDNSRKDGYKYMCKQCKKAEDQSRKNKFRQLKLCPYCGKQPEINYIVCQSCRIKKQKYDNKIKRQLRHNYRLKNDINYHIAHNLRSRLRYAIKNQQKTGSAIKDLGCSIEYLKIYLESKFISGMSWNNYGQWHIDHIIPLSQFDLSNRQELLKACHYTNLQPMWAIDNIKKSNH